MLISSGFSLHLPRTGPTTPELWQVKLSMYLSFATKAQCTIYVATVASIPSVEGIDEMGKKKTINDHSYNIPKRYINHT